MSGILQMCHAIIETAMASLVELWSWVEVTDPAIPDVRPGRGAAAAAPNRERALTA
jgi:hypothetical protein